MLGMAYDTPIAGFRNRTVNTLRLWRARSPAEFDLADFNAGDYLAAVDDKNSSENISKVLYPNDLTVMGKELRLQQQYFFVACSLHDIVTRHLKIHPSFDNFPDKVAIQLNDTHPAIAIAELMRLLLDEHGLAWSKAWDIGQAVFGYTNHTLLPEALEKWTVELLGRVLPRHLEIIYEVNDRFLEKVRGDARFDAAAVERMSLIEEGTPKQVRMANLAVVGSHSVNGVAALHTELLQNELFHDFFRLWPEKFNNKTNGVTPAALDHAGQPRAGLDAERGGRARLDHRRRASCERLELVADDAGVPAPLPGDQAGEQGAAGRDHPARERPGGGPVVDLRRPGEADPRVQAAAARRPLHRPPVPADEGRPVLPARRRAPGSSPARRRPAT